MMMVPITKVKPESAFPQINGPRRPRRSMYQIHSASPMSAITELPACSPRVVEVSMPMLWKISGE